jgi:hypothetical protein
MLNAHYQELLFRLGGRSYGIQWHCLFDTATPGFKGRPFRHISNFPLHAPSIALLRAESNEGDTNE